jgi:hypothetical protein
LAYSPIDRKEALDFAKKIQEKSVEAFFKSDNGVAAKVKTALGLSLKSESHTVKFLKAYSNRRSSPQEFWKGLRQDEDLKDKVDDLLLTSRLSALTGNHLPLVTKLQAKIKNHDVTQLFSLQKEEWNEMIASDFPEFMEGTTIDEKRQNYIHYMNDLLCAAFPNEKIRYMIKAKELIPAQSDIVRDNITSFLESTNFDLRLRRWHDRIDDESEKTFEDKLNEFLNGADSSKIKTEINKIQRVLQFSPSPEIMKKFMEKGIHSASQVESIPIASFKMLYKDIADEDTLVAIHKRASHIVSMIQNALLNLNKLRQSTRIPAITGQSYNSIQ